MMNFDQNLDLPHDLITYGIIIRLPIKSLLQSKLVSKQWYSTLSSPHFGNAHFKFSDFNGAHVCNLLVQSGNDYFIYNYDENVGDCDIDGIDVGCVNVKGLCKVDAYFDGLPKDKILVVGSCNGLVCLYCLLGYVIIWNPIIHGWVKFCCPLLEGCKNSTWGFGYVHSVDDYKVVRISEMVGDTREIIVDVFSLKSGKWKQVHDVKVHDQYVLRGASMSAGVLINETLYWIMYKRNGDYEIEILGFDLVFEKFDEIGCLVPGDSYLGWVRFLGAMGGCLSMSRFTSRGDVSISILKHNGHVEYVGLYRDLHLGSCCSAVGFTTDGKFFIQLGERELGLVNPNTSPKRYIPLVKFEGNGFIDIKSFAPSLISPLAVAEMHTR